MARRTSGRIPGIGYMRQPVPVDALSMVGQWVAVLEEFEDPLRDSGLVLVTSGLPTTVFGRVLKAGSECELEGVKAGDRILFERWAGGRWALKDAEGRDTHVLIMSADFIVARVREDE